MNQLTIHPRRHPAWLPSCSGWGKGWEEPQHWVTWLFSVIGILVFLKALWRVQLGKSELVHYNVQYTTCITRGNKQAFPPTSPPPGPKARLCTEPPPALLLLSIRIIITLLIYNGAGWTRDSRIFIFCHQSEAKYGEQPLKAVNRYNQCANLTDNFLPDSWSRDGDS